MVQKSRMSEPQIKYDFGITMIEDTPHSYILSSFNPINQRFRKGKKITPPFIPPQGGNRAIHSISMD